MAASFGYWDECIDPLDMDAMWMDPDVCAEWKNAGESEGHKVHLSRDPDGQAYLTQTEMKAVAGIIVSRHFHFQIDPDMICAIAELESDRQPGAVRYNRKTKEATLGIMQILPKTAAWMASELGYRIYPVDEDPNLLYRPFVSVYLGAAYLQWLSNYEQKERSEEFVVRSYKGGTKKATHKSTLPYWRRYLSVKESLPPRKSIEHGPVLNDSSTSTAQPAALPQITGNGAGSGAGEYTHWDSRVSLEDMDDMWVHPEVNREWTKSGEKRGKVRFSHDAKKRPYLSQIEMKAVAQIILFKHFSTGRVKPTVLCAIAEIISMRFVNGVGSRIGVMGIDYPTALWLHNELGFKAYRIETADDLCNPFISVYYGAAHMAWLSEYEGRERTPQFVVQAFIAGPKNVNLQETGPLWLKFEEALSKYEDIKREQGSCTIL